MKYFSLYALWTGTLSFFFFPFLPEGPVRDYLGMARGRVGSGIWITQTRPATLPRKPDLCRDGQTAADCRNEIYFKMVKIMLNLV